MEKVEKLIADVISQIEDWKGEDLTYERWPDFFMWNCNWAVSVNGKKYFVKIPGEKSELSIEITFTKHLLLQLIVVLVLLCPTI